VEASVKEIAEQLGIDTELVARDLAFYRGVGTGYSSHIGQYSERRSWEPIAYAATAFRRAASHALLLDDAGLAAEMFGNSAKCYEALRRPYAAMMWTLARNLDSASASSDRSVVEFIASEGRYPSEQSGQMAYPLLVESVVDLEEQPADDPQARRGRFRRVTSELSALSTTPLGMMGIPIASYLGLAASLEENVDPHEAEYHLLPFLNAYEVAITTARSKTYHWQRLLMPFHPAEPDILSVLSVANGWFKRRKIALTDFVRERTDNRFASKVLSAALEQID
jgi:hypothetical protein